MSASTGLIHVYYGYGKGKTTCALGLALRASGAGLKVVIVQFLKGSDTCELSQLNKLDNITVVRGKPENSPCLAARMTEEELIKSKKIHDSNLRFAIELIKAGKCDVLILDEGIDAYQLDLVDKNLFKGLICNKPSNLEIIITGHKPDEWLIDHADYVTEMVKHKHPFDEGVKARRGIEM